MPLTPRQCGCGAWSEQGEEVNMTNVDQQATPPPDPPATKDAADKPATANEACPTRPPPPSAQLVVNGRIQYP